MDSGGSFLDLACIRIAIVPAAPMTESRFSFLASQIAALDQLPANALPKPQQSPRRSFLSASSSSHAATYSGIPADFRNFLQQAQATPSQNNFSRSRSLTQQAPARRTHSLSPPRNSTPTPPPHPGPSRSPPPSATAQSSSGGGVGTNAAGSGSAWPGSDGDSDAFVRLRYIPIHRDSSGNLLTRPSSEWDEFQCRRVWGVIGIVDGTDPESSAAPESRDRALAAARTYFAAALEHFPGATVSRLVVFTTPDVVQEHGSFVSVIDGGEASSPSGSAPDSSEPDAINGKRTNTVSTTVPADSAAAAAAMAAASGIPVPSSPLSISSRASVIAAAAATAPGGRPGSSSTGANPSSQATAGGSASDDVDAVSSATGADSEGGHVEKLSESTALPSSASGTSLSSLPSATGAPVGGQSAAPKVAPSGSGAPSSSAGANPAVASLTAAQVNGTGMAGGDQSGGPVNVGYVPIRLDEYAEETKLEIRAQIVHFAGLLLASLENWMHQETLTADVFLSPLDDGNSTDRQSKLTKRRLGRLDKLQGDYLLLTGSSSEALGKYNSAIERAKANGDSLWLAGAMEGSCAALAYSHVTSGGQIDGAPVVSRALEQYPEIYKLYRKKRVPELEAASAVRLAEYLGRWTKHRKDALEAMGHAASVGENLRAGKKQALWEALARFSEYMGCRRKAALYLYRLGLLEASEDSWGKAVTLMNASAGQFRAKNTNLGSVGAWPDLHRRVLLEAANSGRLAGDHAGSARHSIEALSLSPAVRRTAGESDGAIAGSLLYRGHVPAWVECAEELLSVTELCALQMSTLSVQPHDADSMAHSLGTMRSNDSGGDPFLYNPFAARDAAAKAAEAGRAVTWVCGETAHIALTIRNRLKTRITAEVIAVSVAEAGREAHVWPSDRFSTIGVDCGGGGNDIEVSNSKGFREVDESAKIRAELNVRTKRMRTTLRAISRVSTTVSQSLDIDPCALEGDCDQRSSTSSFRLSVIPRKSGNMRICGVVLRLFSGAIVMLPVPSLGKAGEEAPPIEVMAPLPQLEVTLHAESSSRSMHLGSKLPIDIFEGEHMHLTARIRNVGTDAISKARIYTRCDRHDAVRMVSQSSDTRVVSKAGKLQRGESCLFSLQIYAARSSDDSSRMDSNGPLEVSVSVDVEYTGRERNSHLRTTSATSVLTISPAIRIGRVSSAKYNLLEAMSSGSSLLTSTREILKCEMPSHAFETSSAQAGAPPVEERTAESSRADSPGQPSKSGMQDPELGMVVDVSTHSVAPVLVSLVDTGRGPKAEQLNALSRPGHPGELNAYKACVVESGACARLLTPLQLPITDSDSKTSEWTKSMIPSFSLKWAIPSFGRSGVVPIHRKEVEKVLSDLSACPSKEQHALALSPASGSLYRSLAISVKLHVQDCDYLSSPGSISVGAEQNRTGIDDDANGGVRSVGDANMMSGASVSALQILATPVLALKYYQVQVEVRNTGAQTLPDSSTLDVVVCQLDGRGGSVPVGVGILVGGHSGVSFGGLAPGATQWHKLLLRLSSSGLFDIVANVYDSEATVKPLGLDSFLSPSEIEKSHTGSSTLADAGPVSPSPSPTPPATSPTAEAAVSPTHWHGQGHEAGTPRRGSHRTSLKRVGLTRRKRHDLDRHMTARGGRSASNGHSNYHMSSNAVHPVAASDEHDSLFPKRFSPPFGSGRLTVQAVNDTRWSTGGLVRNIPSASNGNVDSGPSTTSGLSELEDSHRHLHGPDTIVH